MTLNVREVAVESPGAPAIVTTVASGAELVVEAPSIPQTVIEPPRVPLVVADPTTFTSEVVPVRGAPGRQGKEGPAGPPGPPGPQGSGVEMIFQFPTPSKSWICNHPFEREILDVVTVDTNDDEIIGDVRFPAPGLVVIDWYYDTAGTARIST